MTVDTSTAPWQPLGAPRTDREIGAIPVPAKGEIAVWFEEVSGLHLRIRSTGSRSWVFQYYTAGRRQRVTLGTWPGVTRLAAITAAKKHRGAVAQGGDPAAERKAARNRVTAGEAFDIYLEHVRATRSPSYAAENERYLTKALAKLRPLPVEALDAVTIAGALDGVTGKVARNRAAAALSVALKHAAGRGQAPTMLPYIARSVPKPAENPRDRVLSYEELGRLWRAAEAELTAGGTIVRLLLLLGLRRSEIGDLQAQEVDRAEKVLRLPPARIKIRQARTVALTDLALGMLPKQAGFLFGRSGLTGFSGWSRLWERLEKSAELKGATLHDLRRAISTHLGEHKDARRDVIEMLLGHVQPGVASVYNHSQMITMQREHLELWEVLLREKKVMR